MPADDFWPADLTNTSNITTPVSMMREQAALLGQKTNQQLTATVVPMTTGGGEFVWSFQLISTILVNYRYELFRVSHTITLYPAVFYWEAHPTSKVVASQDDFKSYMKEIIGSDQTKKIVQGLLAQIIK